MRTSRRPQKVCAIETDWPSDLCLLLCGGLPYVCPTGYRYSRFHLASSVLVLLFMLAAVLSAHLRPDLATLTLLLLVCAAAVDFVGELNGL